MYEVKYYDVRDLAWHSVVFFSLDDAYEFVMNGKNMWFDMEVSRDGKMLDLAKFVHGKQAVEF